MFDKILKACPLAALLALLASHGAQAQMQPHRAEYVLRFGTAANAPRIGTAVQDITADCTGWHIKRDVLTEIALTSSLKVSVASKLSGEEARDGNAFRYRALQIQNGAEHDVRGDVRRADGKISVEVSSAGGVERPILPPPTLMPIAAIDHLIRRLLAKATLAPTPVFGAEASGNAYLIDVKEVEATTLRRLPPAIKAVDVPAKNSWPVALSVTRGPGQDPKPLFTLRGRIFDSGVLDRLTVDAGIATIAVDLEALEMHKAPACPESR